MTTAATICQALPLSLSSPVRWGLFCSHFIEEEAEAEREWPSCPGSHSLETVVLAVGLLLIKGVGRHGDQARAPWHKS